MLRTLSILLNLYREPDTDRHELLKHIESDTQTLAAFLQSASPTTLTDWHSELSTEELNAVSLALANQITLEPLTPIANSTNHQLVEFSRALMSVLDPDRVREAELLARLAGTEVEPQEPHLAQALRYFQRPLDTLHGTHVTTRVLACAENLTSKDRDTALCATLLSLDANLLEDLTRGSGQRDVQQDDSPDAESLFSEALTRANLYNSTVQLAQHLDVATCLREICTTLFATQQISIYRRRQDSWNSGSLEFDAPQSLIVSAAVNGVPVNTTDHKMTVLDEEALADIGAIDGIAVPVLLESNNADTCVAVVLIGLAEPDLKTLAARPELLTMFCETAAALFKATPSQTVNMDDIDNRAREIIHEANNPLSTVQNYLKVLSLKLGPEHAAQPTIESISSELMRAAGIIQSFRNIPETASINRGNCDINRSLREVALLFEQANGGITFEYQIGPPAIASIGTDDFKQIATNLIKNAVEELSPGNRITLSTQSNLVFQEKRWIEITFADSGPGIQSGVGDIFARGVSTKTGDHAGEGLAVVRQLTERHGGFVSYRSDKNGTEFRITLLQSQNRGSQ